MGFYRVGVIFRCVVDSFGDRYCTCTAASSMACAFFGPLSLDSAAAEGSAFPYLLAFLCRWRSTHCFWAIAARVHPPVDRNQNIGSCMFMLQVSVRKLNTESPQWRDPDVFGHDFLKSGAVSRLIFLGCKGNV